MSTSARPRSRVLVAVGSAALLGAVLPLTGTAAVEPPEGAYEGPWSVVVHATDGRAHPVDDAWSDLTDGSLQVTRGEAGGVALGFGEAERLELAPSEGDELVPGRYPLLERLPEGQESGFELLTSDGLCAGDGSFTVLEHRLDPWRFVAELDTGCGTGRVEIGGPRADGPAPLVATTRWQPSFPGVTAVTKTVRLVNGGPLPVTLGAARPTDAARAPGAEDFAVVEDRCVGVLPAGQVCEVDVAVTVAAAGPRAADLVVPGPRGRVVVPLDAEGRPGTTYVEVADRDGTTRVDPTTGSVRVTGDATALRVDVSSEDPEVAGTLRLQAPRTGLLRAGQTLRQDTGGFSVGDLDGRVDTSCFPGSRSVVDELTFDEDGRVQSLALRVARRCGPLFPLGGGQVAVSWQTDAPVVVDEVVDAVPGPVADLRVAPDPAQVLLTWSPLPEQPSRTEVRLAEGTEPPGYDGGDRLEPAEDARVGFTPRAGADYALSTYVQASDGVRGERTDIVLRGSGTDLRARERRDGRVVVTGAIGDTMGSPVSRAPVALELWQGTTWRERFRRTDDRGRFRLVVNRLREVRSTFLGRPGVIGSYATARTERQERSGARR